MDLGSKGAGAHIALLLKDLWLSVQNIYRLVFTITFKTLFWVFALSVSLSLRNQNWFHVTVFPTPEVHHSHFALLQKDLWLSLQNIRKLVFTVTLKTLV